MSDSRSVLFGNMQYQISEPTQNEDGYYYQRVRQIDRDGNLVGDGEFIAKSAQPDSTDGLFDPNGGRQAGYIAARSAYDIGRMAAGAALRKPTLFEAGAADIVHGGTDGFPLPAPLRAEYHSWPGTEQPWDQRTLNSDRNLTWRPSYIERMFYGDPQVSDTSGATKQIGDGTDIAPWISAMSGIDPQEPTPPAWPPQADTPIRYLSRRVQ
jgi:hypothetical protein